MDQLEEQLIRSLTRFHKLAAFVIKGGPCADGPEKAESGKNGPGKGRYIVMSAAWRIYCKSENHRVQVGDIVDELQIPAPAVSRALKDLEADGILLRMTDPGDRRITLVTFTDKGAEHVKACTDMVDRLFDRAAGKMGNENVRMLCCLLDRFYGCMEESIREAPAPGKTRGDETL